MNQDQEKADRELLENWRCYMGFCCNHCDRYKPPALGEGSLSEFKANLIESFIVRQHAPNQEGGEGKVCQLSKTNKLAGNSCPSLFKRD